MAARLTIIGLGPGDPALRTLAAQRALDLADRIVLRTTIHPGLDDLIADPRVSSCDDLYDQAANFDDLYAAIAERVCDLAATSAGAIVFALPGHPRYGERSVPLIEARAAAQGIEVTVQAAVSAFDALAAALRVDLLSAQVQLIDAVALVAITEREPFAGGELRLDPSKPCLVSQVYAPHVAAATKLALSRLFPDTHPIVVARAAGIPGDERLNHCALFELDRQPVDHLTSVWLPALPALEAVRAASTLQRIVAHLRTPEGCPWDRKQTHVTLRDAVIEEAYETVDAIDAGDLDHLAEELGDLLLQVALHAQIAEEAGSFQLEDIYEHLSRKLIRRHPHVFGDAEARTPDEVVTTWEAVKAAERASAGAPAKPPAHPLDKLPRSMGALRRATTLLAPRKGSSRQEPLPEAILATGETLLATVEAAARAGIDPEQALEEALRRHVEAAGGRR